MPLSALPQPPRRRILFGALFLLIVLYILGLAKVSPYQQFLCSTQHTCGALLLVQAAHPPTPSAPWPPHLDLAGTGVSLFEAFPSRWATLHALRNATPPASASACAPASPLDDAGAAAIFDAAGLRAADFTRSIRAPLEGVGVASGVTLDVNSGAVYEWARIRAVYDRAGGVEFGTREQRPRVRMGASSRARFCETPEVRRDAISRMFAPLGGCGSDSGDAAAGSGADAFDERHNVYLNDPNEAIHILSADCVMTGNNAPQIVQFMLFNPRRIFAQLEGWIPAPPARMAVLELGESASIGPMVYPNAMGHFINEALVQYFLLDALLPGDVALLVGHEGRGLEVLRQLRTAGVLRTERPWVHVSPNEPSLIRARRMFFLRPTDRDFNEYPPLTATGMRLLSAALSGAAWRRAHAGAPPPPPLGAGDEERALTVLILSRGAGESRSVVNEVEVMDAVRRIFGSALRSISALIPGGDFFDVGRQVSEACLVIGPHGANLGNIIWLSPGCWVVEIGYLAAPGAFKLPHTYHGMARNLNLTYWTSFAKSGSHETPLVADVGDLEEIFRAYRNEMLVPRGWT